MPWSAEFDEPIPLSGRKPLRTLRDAANFVMRLRPAERGLAHWQIAAGELLTAAERGPTMFARIAMLRALNHGKPVPRDARRAKKYRVVS